MIFKVKGFNNGKINNYRSYFILELPLEKAASLCYEQEGNLSLPVIQTEEAHQSLVRFMMEHNISSAWLGWKSEQLKNWTWGNSEICKYQIQFF